MREELMKGVAEDQTNPQKKKWNREGRGNKSNFGEESKQ